MITQYEVTCNDDSRQSVINSKIYLRSFLTYQKLKEIKHTSNKSLSSCDRVIKLSITRL